MKPRYLTFPALMIALSQTACITTLHTDHYPYRQRTVVVERPRPIYVPAPRPTVVTVHRY